MRTRPRRRFCSFASGAAGRTCAAVGSSRRGFARGARAGRGLGSISGSPTRTGFARAGRSATPSGGSCARREGRGWRWGRGGGEGPRAVERAARSARERDAETSQGRFPKRAPTDASYTNLSRKYERTFSQGMRLTVIGRRGRIRSTTDRVRARKSTNRRWSDSSEGGKTENRRAVTEKCATREPSLGKTSAHFRRRDPARSSAPALSPVERFDSRLRLIARASRREIHHVGRSRSVTDRLRASARVSEEAVLGVIFLWRER